MSGLRIAEIRNFALLGRMRACKANENQKPSLRLLPHGTSFITSGLSLCVETRSEHWLPSAQRLEAEFSWVLLGG